MRALARRISALCADWTSLVPATDMEGDRASRESARAATIPERVQDLSGDANRRGECSPGASLVHLQAHSGGQEAERQR